MKSVRIIAFDGRNLLIFATPHVASQALCVIMHYLSFDLLQARMKREACGGLPPSENLAAAK